MQGRSFILFWFIVGLFAVGGRAYGDGHALKDRSGCDITIRGLGSRSYDGWKIENAPEDEGYILYGFVRGNPLFPKYHLWVKSYKGIRDRRYPGVGSSLLRYVRERYPDLTIGGLMAGTNLSKTREALLKRPGDPDLSSIPFLQVLGGNFSFHPDFSLLQGRLTLVPTIFSTPSGRGADAPPFWLNREFLIENPLYWRWVEQEWTSSAEGGSHP